MKPTKEQVQKIFNLNRDWFKIEITDNSIRVEMMYEYVPCGLKELIALANLIGTDRFDIDQSHSSGCETCDYGSSYEKVFTWKQEDVGIFDALGIKNATL